MFRFLVALAILSFCLLFQASFVKVLWPLAPNLNLVLLLPVLLGVHCVTPGAAIVIFILGVMNDLFSGGIIGPWAVSYLVVFVANSIVSNRIYLKSVISVMAVVFLSALLAEASHVVLLARFAPLTWESMYSLFYGAVLVALISPFFMGLFRFLLRLNKEEYI